MKLRRLILWTLLGFSQSLVAQESAIDELLGKLQRYADETPKEKVYLHLDKPYYAVGDDIWFKGYVTIGPLNYLSAFSKILYVDLIDPDDKIVQSLRLPLIAGVTRGDFRLEDTLQAGDYRIRAYTNWMRNFESTNFFDRTLRVGNIQSAATAADSALVFDNTKAHVSGTFSVPGGPSANMDVFDRASQNQQAPIGEQGNQEDNNLQFFPESGRLVSGNPTKIGFKALRADGLGIGVRGHLADQSGKHVAEFESEYAGIGSFSFTPQAGQRYTAQVTYADGSQAQVDFPDVTPVGYALTVNNDADKEIFVQVFASEELVQGQEVMLLLQRNAYVFYATKGKLAKNKAVFSVPRENIPAGVVQLTLFSPEMEPLAERTIFNFADDMALPITVTTEKQDYNPKEKVTVQLSVGQDADTNRVATLSAAVIDVEKVPIAAQETGNIYASLLLASDVRGYIETPAYYFENTNEAKRRQLDQLMLTHGGSRMNWQALLAGETPTITYHPERDLRVSGTVLRRNGATPVPNARVTLLATGRVQAVLDTVADENGRFNFDRLLFYDDAKFVIQARDDRGRRNVDVQLDESSRAEVTGGRNAPDATVNVKEAMATYLKNREAQFKEMQRHGLNERTVLLEEVKVTRDTGERWTRHSSNLNGPGNADQIITADQLLQGCMTLDICLQGRLLGVVFRNGVPYSTRSFNQPMQIVLDGMFLDANALSMINPFDVESIEVLRRAGNTAIYGVRGGGGVLIITTKRGDGGGYNSDLYTPGIVTYSPQGYYEVREFDAPDYSVAGDLPSAPRDLRTTIHWAPNVITNEEGNASFTFYTAEQAGIYRIIVEGLDVDGRLARATHYITVN